MKRYDVFAIVLGCITLTGAAQVTSGGLSTVSRVCAVAVDDLSGSPAAALRATGFEAVTLPFEPPADVDHAARVAGCGYVLYTDVVQATETAGSRFARGLRRLFTSRPPAGPGAFQAQLEFRLYQIDDGGPPMLSTSVTGKSSARELQPQVESRVVSMGLRPNGAVTVSNPALLSSPAARVDSLRTAALHAAFSREAKVIRAAFRALADGRLSELKESLGAW